MKISTIVMFIILSFSCGEIFTSQSKNRDSRSVDSRVKIVEYSVNTIPAFFEAIIKEHFKEIKTLDSSLYKQFCASNELDSKNSKNEYRYYTLSFLHKFFTCQNASNGSRGEIINIPYYWHWVSPNPRYNIYFNKSNKKLNEIKPSKEFSKYKSVADIDRTPYLFLSDIFVDDPKYYSSLSDTFSTFGWCSEREMAFVSLLDILGYDGKVIAENNHSWSEFIIPMIVNENQSKEFKVKVDNTFDEMDWENVLPADIISWKKYQGKSKLANWYNLKAHSEKEKVQISTFPISKVAIKRIENGLVDYFERAINEH